MQQFPIKSKQSLIDTNNKINELFDSNQPFSVIRMGNTEGYFLKSILEQQYPVDEFFVWLELMAGVYPVSFDYLCEEWAPINYAALLNADTIGFVDISKEIKNDSKFCKSHFGDKHLFFDEDIHVFDPAYLSNTGILDVECDNPWTKQLKDKRVLIVSAFKDTIEYQLKNIDAVWGDKKNDILPYTLVDVIRAPFHPSIDNRQFDNCDTWDKTLQMLINAIDTHEYDVLLVSAGAYGPALANYAKLQNKIGITVGGALQLHFGILGPRWGVNDNAYKVWSKMFNTHWINVMQHDTPLHKELFTRYENAYWV